MQAFTYHIPTKIHFGKGQLVHLTELSESGHSVLLVYGLSLIHISEPTRH